MLQQRRAAPRRQCGRERDRLHAPHGAAPRRGLADRLAPPPLLLLLLLRGGLEHGEPVPLAVGAAAVGGLQFGGRAVLLRELLAVGAPALGGLERGGRARLRRAAMRLPAWAAGGGPEDVAFAEEAATERLVMQFEHIRAQAFEPLATFLDYVTYSYMIDNILLLLRGSIHSKPVADLLARCHPLGKFDAMAVVAACESPEELYTTILIDRELCPVGKYFEKYMNDVQSAEGGKMDGGASVVGYMPAA